MIGGFFVMYCHEQLKSYLEQVRMPGFRIKASEEIQINL